MKTIQPQLPPKPEKTQHFRQRFLNLLQEKHALKERRERIATQVLCGLIADNTENPEPEYAAAVALAYTDALIDALDDDMNR